MVQAGDCHFSLVNNMVQAGDCHFSLVNNMVQAGDCHFKSILKTNLFSIIYAIFFVFQS